MNNTSDGDDPEKIRNTFKGFRRIDKSSARDFEPTVERFYTSEESFIHDIRNNLAEIMTLTCDVFVTSYDLVLLDYSHGLFGGYAKKESPEDIESLSEAEVRIRCILHRLSPHLPVIWTEVGVSYFVPALTMPRAGRLKFYKLPELEKLKVALQTKRVFVNGETFLDYGGGGKQMPDPDFWSALFKFDADHACSEDEIFGISAEFAPGASSAFWLERCIDRDGGEPRFIDHIDLKALTAEDSEKLVRSIEALALEWGMDRNAGWLELTRYGAAFEM